MKLLILVYDPRNWNTPRATPVDFALVTSPATMEKARYLTEYPDSHVVLKVYKDEAGTRTVTTVAGFKMDFV